MLAALVTPILFSLSVICGHRSARLIGGTEANFWRITVATLFLAFWAYARGSGLSGVAFPLFLASGIFGIGIGDVAFFQALPRLGSRLSLLLIECLSAPFGALVEWLWLGTRLSTPQVVCGLIILAGVGVALSPGAHVERNKRALLIGTLFSVVGAFGTAIGAVLSRRAYEVARLANETPDAGTAAFQRVVGGLLLAGLCLLLVKRRTFHRQALTPHPVIIEDSVKKWKGVWIWVVLNSLFGQTLGVTCMQEALRTTPTGIVLAVIAITPIVVVPLAYLFEGERPGLRSLLGGIVAVGGVIALIAVSPQKTALPPKASISISLANWPIPGSSDSLGPAMFTT